MKISLQLVALSLLAAAIGAIGFVAYAGASITRLSLEQANNAVTASQESDRVAYEARVKAISKDTADERAVLDSIMKVDVVGIANTLESTASSVGVSAKVSDAVAQGTPSSISGGATVQALAYVVEASGRFSDLVALVRAYEALPLPSTVDEIELGRPAISSATGSTPWHLTVRVRVLTTSQVSL